RLLRIEATAVAKAACDSGVAQEPISNWDDYVRKLDAMTNVSERVMRRIRVSFGKSQPRVLFPDGENRRVLEACHILVQDGIGRPVLVGSEEAISAKLAEVGLRPEEIDIVNPMASDQLGALADELYRVAGRKGTTPFKARKLVETPLHFGVMLLRTGQVDALVAGADDNYSDTLRALLPMNETLPRIQRGAGFNILFVDGQVFVIGDTTLNIAPDAKQLAQIAGLGADLARDIGLDPKVAMLSFSNFGDNRHPRATKVRTAVEILRAERPDLVVDGEMHGDVAVQPAFADENFPQSLIRGDANVLICPDLDSANISYKLLGYLGHGCEVIGPILEGFRYPINVVSYRSTVREIANLAAFSASRAAKLSG
ncbi:MAG TPA: phosphate acyltransferase, partial [Fimbriimonadaceae bacterium]|nr:phosphate acyltransferase [Fimbriimonadaceae bacterium]